MDFILFYIKGQMHFNLIYLNFSSHARSHDTSVGNMASSRRLLCKKKNKINKKNYSYERGWWGESQEAARTKLPSKAMIYCEQERQSGGTESGTILCKLSHSEVECAGMWRRHLRKRCCHCLYLLRMNPDRMQTQLWDRVVKMYSSV